MQTKRLWVGSNHFLEPHHQKELRASGLTLKTIKKSGVWSAHFHEVGELLGNDRNLSSGLVFPYPTLDGEKPYAAVKLDDVEPDADGKVQRYRLPSKRGNRLYIPLTFDRSVLQDVSRTLCLTEGQKKTLAAIQNLIDCVGLSGVFNWRMKNDKGFAVPIPDLDEIECGGRRVEIVFDSDATTNPNVLTAEKRLAVELSRRGARVFSVRLPEGPNGNKVGLDDYLKEHDKEEFPRWTVKTGHRWTPENRP